MKLKRSRIISWSGTSRAMAFSHVAYVLFNPKGCHLHQSLQPQKMNLG